MKLLKEGLKAKIVLPEGGEICSEMGTPQGGVLSPLLANIYLHELDLFMEDLKKKFEKGVRRRNSLDYTRHIKRGGNAVSARAIGLRKTDPLDETFRRLHYVRYADDFVVGIVGSMEDSAKVRNEIRDFLKQLKLTLHETKTRLTHWEEHVKFLGYVIGYKQVSYRFRVKGTYRAAERRILTLHVDVQKVVDRLSKKGFCDLAGTPKPCMTLMPLPQSVANARIRSTILGLSNYYSLANNRRRSIRRVAYILQHSLAKMYAAKFKLKTRAKVFARGGKDLSKPLESRRGTLGGSDADLEK